MSISRADNSPFARWWWTVDRMAFAGIVALIAVGLLLAVAASPAATGGGTSAGNFTYALKQLVFAATAMAILVGAALLDFKQMRVAAAVVFAFALIGSFIALFLTEDVNGAHRWIDFGEFKLQPSEFLKPAFVILIAWLFAESTRRPEMPANTTALALLLMVVALLVMQPDFGQTMLIALVWGALFFMAGMRLIWVGGLAGCAAIGLVGAYFTVPHVAQRIQRFMDRGSGDTFNIDLALESFARGGWFGRGPGEGTVKRILPESHTDFVFAVGAEEFGIVLCLMLLALFAFIVIRSLRYAVRNDNPFTRFAVSGLAILFGLQSAINMAVNLHLMPAKGMTLPFVSYGGSSMISLAYGMGMLLALTRDRPRAELLSKQDLDRDLGLARSTT
jgi:cell division protein FtsW